MGEVSQPDPVLLIVAAFSRHADALAWAHAQAVTAWGPIRLESPLFDFVETDYYIPTMGPQIKKCFWALEQLIDPATLPAVKLQTNGWEEQFAARGEHAEPRPLNLDPGYLTPAKLVLASTKDHVHRVYVAQGIYAEVTLFYKDRRWQPREWTFPNYRRADYHEFFEQCRRYLRSRQREDRAP